MTHGTAKGEAVGDEPSGSTGPGVALGPFAVGPPPKRTPREAHASFINRLETHGHSPEHAARVAHRCSRKVDDRS